jgi:hypothetical protein
MNHTFAFSQLGSIAYVCLLPGQRGKVLAAFSKAIYFQTDSGELFWMATTEAPLHRRCAQAASHLPELTAGLPFTVQDHHLVVDSAFTFDIPDALPWHTPRPNQILPLISLASRIQTFFSTIDYSHATGFGYFIPHILSLNLSTTPLPDAADPVLHFAQPLVLDMARACLEHDHSRIHSIANSLIGLGTGLTPSGDDFLGGMLFALKILRSAYPDQFTDYAFPIESYRLRTHLISFTLLDDLAEGHALAPLHSIINGLLSGKSLESIYPFVSQLTRVGHSTGWELFSGLLVGLLATYQSHYFISASQMLPVTERN